MGRDWVSSRLANLEGNLGDLGKTCLSEIPVHSVGVEP